jgi:hypothetical protein
VIVLLVVVSGEIEGMRAFRGNCASCSPTVGVLIDMPRARTFEVP